MVKNILKIIAIFIIGMVGGIFADQIFWPYFIERPLFYQYHLESRPIQVIERKEIVIRENTALVNAVEKVEKIVVGVRTKNKAGKILEGSGLIVTSDGLLVTLADLLPQGGEPLLFLDGRTPSFQILKRDLKENLVLVKVSETNLSTVGFGDLGKVKIGERVFLIGTIFEKGVITKKVVNEGIIKSFNENSIQTNILEEENISGSSLFDIEGNFLGLNTINKEGKVSAISISQIKSFIGF